LIPKIENLQHIFGTIIGNIANILDANLVTIKLNNLDLIKGINLIFLERDYCMS